MAARHLAGLALLLLHSLAFAGVPITEFRQPPPAPASALGADGRPIPERAGALSARNTLVPVGVGTAMCAIGASGSMTQGGYGAGAGLFVLGMAVATVGLVMGPSAGYAYGGIPDRGTAGTLLRLGTLIAPAIVLAAQQRGSGSDEAWIAPAIGLLLGAGLVTLEAVYDVATVEGNVRRHNAALTRSTSWRLEPCVTPTAHAPALALRASFGGPEGY
jgi:hypothetical protein